MDQGATETAARVIGHPGTEMIERVAKAIHDVNENTMGLRYTDLTRAMARAAIEAMREPTQAMIDATLWPNTDRESPVEEIYQAMVDGALKPRK